MGVGSTAGDAGQSSDIGWLRHAPGRLVVDFPGSFVPSQTESPKNRSTVKNCQRPLRHGLERGQRSRAPKHFPERKCMDAGAGLTPPDNVQL